MSQIVKTIPSEILRRVDGHGQISNDCYTIYKTSLYDRGTLIGDIKEIREVIHREPEGGILHIKRDYHVTYYPVGV